MKSLHTLLLATVAVSAAGAAIADDNLKVVTSIKPLYSLATAITAGTETETTLLVKGAASPHTYSMAPSEALAYADLKLPLANLDSLEASHSTDRRGPD